MKCTRNLTLGYHRSFSLASIYCSRISTILITLQKLELLDSSCDGSVNLQITRVYKGKNHAEIEFTVSDLSLSSHFLCVKLMKKILVLLFPAF